MSDLIWLTKAQMRQIEPYFPLSHSALGNLPPAIHAMLDAPVMQRDGTSERSGGSTPRPVASPSQTGSNVQRTLLPTG